MNDEHDRCERHDVVVAPGAVRGRGRQAEGDGRRREPRAARAQWGIGLTILGFVIAVISWLSAQGLDATSTSILRSQIVRVIGVGIAIVGIVIWVRNSLTRYLRYWIIRLVYEQREQTEQLDPGRLRDE